MTKKYAIAKKSIERKNLLVISSYAEVIKSNSGNYIVKDLIYLEFHKGFEQKSRVSMAINCMKLRGFYYALKELYKTKTSSYEDYTDASSSNNSKSGGKKRLTVNFQNNTYYCNLSYNNETLNISFDTYSLLSFIDTLECLANITDEITYNYHRKYSSLKG